MSDRGRGWAAATATAVVGAYLAVGGHPPAAELPAPDPPAPAGPEARRAVDDRPAEPVRGWAGPLPPLAGAGPHGTHVSTGSAAVALTFDDGPDPTWTPQVLTLLAEYGVTATFCVTGENATAYPGLVRQIAAAGHTLCNHTWDHDIHLGSRHRFVIWRDLVRTELAIRAAVGGDVEIRYYRQPGGAWTASVVAVAADLGMSALHWTVDPQDWRRPGAGPIVETVAGQAGPGAIVLLHDGGGDRRDTVAALRRLLPHLTGRVRLAALPGAEAEPVSAAASGQDQPPVAG